MRPRQFWVYMSIYISAIALLLYINYTIYEYQNVFSSLEDLFRSLYYQFLALQIFTLWFWAAYNSGSAVKDEISEKTFDFFRILPLPARKKASGILVGKNLVVLLLALINCLFLLFFGTMGNLTAKLQGQIFLTLASAAILVNSITLLASINPVKKYKKRGTLSVILIVFLFFFFFVSFGISAFTEFTKIEGLENVSAKFYNFQLPVLLLISSIVLYFSCWTLKGILRKFTREDQPLFTRNGAVIFMFGYEFVLFGLFFSYLIDGAGAVNYSYWAISLLPVLFIHFEALRSFDKYLEHSGFVRERTGSKPNTISSMLLYSNISLGLGLFAIWAVVSVATTLITGLNPLQPLYYILVLFSFFLFLILLLELYVVYSPLSNKIGLLLGFIALVHLFFPLILSLSLENEIIYLFSPLGFFGHIFAESTPGIAAQTCILLVNLILCVIPILLIWKRYNHILTARQKM